MRHKVSGSLRFRKEWSGSKSSNLNHLPPSPIPLTNNLSSSKSLLLLSRSHYMTHKGLILSIRYIVRAHFILVICSGNARSKCELSLGSKKFKGSRKGRKKCLCLSVNSPLLSLSIVYRDQELVPDRSQWCQLKDQKPPRENKMTCTIRMCPGRKKSTRKKKNCSSKKRR